MVFEVDSFFNRNRSHENIQALIEMSVRLNTWNIKPINDLSFLIYTHKVYDVLNNPLSKKVITLSSKVRRENDRPIDFAITLPNNLKSDQIAIGFANKKVDNRKNFKFIEKFDANTNYVHKNDKTVEVVLPLGYLDNKIDIFQRFRLFRYLYCIFTDSSGSQAVSFELAYYNERFRELSEKEPSYSTGRPVDTMLTASERNDRLLFEDNSSPSDWKTAGIGDPIKFKNFFKYFRFLVSKDKVSELANLIEYPAYGSTAGTLSKNDFLKNYNNIFDAELREQINSQKLDQIFRNKNGVLIGRTSVILINEIVPGTYKITGISKALARGK